MRILYITHFFPPRYNSGTETYTLGLAQTFVSQGHQVEVLCADDWDTGKNYWNGVTEDHYGGVPVHRIHLNWLQANDPNRILYTSRPVEEWLDQFLRGRQIDLVHVTSLNSLGVGVLQSVCRAGLPLVLTLMDFWFICPSIQLLRSDGSLCDGKTTDWDCQRCLLAESRLFTRIQKLPVPEAVNSHVWPALAGVTPVARARGFRGMLLNMRERKDMLVLALSLPDCLLTHSEIVRKLIEQNTQAHVTLLKNGHDLSWVGNLAPRARAEKIRFAYVGQIAKIKGVHVLIEAFNKAGLGERASLDIWGDITRNTAYVKQLEALADGNRAIRFRGRYEHNQLGTVLGDIDIVIVPSLWYENAPLVIQEAFAAKIPVVTTNAGGMAEAVTDEVNGLLFARGDAGDLSAKLRRLADDPALLGRLQAGIPSVRRSDEEAAELEAIYHTLIDGKDK